MDSKLEYVLMSFHKADMIAYLHAFPHEFANAFELAISGQQPYARRAAWLLWSCMAPEDARLQPHVARIVDAIANKTEDHQRELIKILLLLTPDSDSEGRLFNCCRDIWIPISSPPSVRITALKMMVKICRNHPPLIRELECLTESPFLESLSDKAKKSAIRLVQECH